MRTVGPFFASVLAWQMALGISQVLIPLYAYELGFSGLAIGSLISLPMFVQIAVRFIGGAAADRWGERTILITAYIAMAAAGPIFTISKTYWALMAAQAVIMYSRGTFFLSAQSLASRLPGEPSVQFGRLGAFNQTGRIGGVTFGGILFALAGFQGGILTLTGLGLLALLCILPVSLGRAQGSRRGRPFQLLNHFGGVFRLRAVYLAMACSFVGAVPATLSQSFLPIYLAEAQFTADWIGTLISVRSVGALLSGLFLARFLTRQLQVPLSLAAVAGVALTVAATPLFTGFVALGVLMLALGCSGILMDIFSQMVCAEASRADQRATTIAIGGVGWNLSHLIVPVVFGALADRFGLASGFYFSGATVLTLGLLVLVLHRWAAPQLPVAATHAGIRIQPKL